MATAVTLKKPDGTEIYPVTDISLVNNGIHAVDIEATTPVPAVETAMLADGAVTSAKIDWSTVSSSNWNITKDSTYVDTTEQVVVRTSPYGIAFVNVLFKLKATISANVNQTVFTGLPAPVAGYYDITGYDINAKTPVRFRISGSTLSVAWDMNSHASGNNLMASFMYFIR